MKLKQTRFVGKLIGKNKLVFDIGANIGVKSALYLSLKNRVVAVEPQSRCVFILKNKFRNLKSISIVNSAVSSKPGVKTLHIQSKYHGFSSLNKNWQKGSKYTKFDAKEKVRVTTLNNLIAEHGLPYYCKIDVEGSEKDILLGLTQKIPLISFEFHGGGEIRNTLSCLDQLKKLGYKKFMIVEAENPPATLTWLTTVKVIDLLKNKNKTQKSNYWGDIYAK